jgi:hypothetical protein
MEQMEHEMPKYSNLKEKAVEELEAFWIITLYLAVFLGSFTFYRRLILKEFGIAYLHYGFALVQALIIAKIILIGQAFGLAKRFERGPLILSVIYKSVLFGVLVLLFSILEHFVEGLFHKEDLASILHHLTDNGMYEMSARAIMMIVAFIPFFGFWEIGRVIGPSKLSAIFFSRQNQTSSPGTMAE